MNKKEQPNILKNKKSVVVVQHVMPYVPNTRLQWWKMKKDLNIHISQKRNVFVVIGVFECVL